MPLDLSNLQSRDERIKALSDMIARLYQVMLERSQIYGEKYPDIPGGSTGIVMHEYIVSKKTGTTRESHKIDSTLVREYREYLKQIADEMATDQTYKHEFRIIGLENDWAGV